MLYVNYASKKLGNKSREKSQWLLKWEQASFTDVNLTYSQMVLGHSPETAISESYNVSYTLGNGLLNSRNVKFKH